MSRAQPAMPEEFPSKAGKATFISAEFKDAELEKLDAWIESLPEPRPDREQAVRMIVREHCD